MLCVTLSVRVSNYLWVCVSFYLGGMKPLSIGVTRVDQTQHKVIGIYGRFLSCMNIYGLGRYFKFHSKNMLFEFCFVK
jgi:hypothetical protein